MQRSPSVSILLYLVFAGPGTFALDNRRSA
jgi:uncharacterized membrane protein YphA (DoxX/SURF4 family)